MTRRQFPPGFVWGVATSAQQIEGAAFEGGRGESIWDRFSASPGNIEDGSNPSEACDHYHRWQEDIKTLEWLGVDAYRFSISWPRILPDGRGRLNPAGLDFYDKLVDGLLAAGIRPFPTLYHWDLPQRLQDQGGWGDRGTVDAFIEYSAAITSKLGDRVSTWVTHNEPSCIAHLGHQTGEHAPGHHDPRESLRAAHHILLSHGRATEVIRQNVVDAEVGIVLNLTPADPASPDKSDQDAARWFDGFFNRWYLDPLFRGTYPEDAIQDRIRQGHLESSELPFVQAGDLKTINSPIDFLGVNYYSRAVMKAGADGSPVPANVVPPEELTDMGWEVYPQGLHDLLVRVHRDYFPGKLYITENGAAYGDGPDDTGRIADARRVSYFQDHLLACHRAIADQVPLAGYFAWSLMDNFEWGHGFSKRFGLYWVDYRTGNRTPKESADWFRKAVATGIVDAAASERSVPSS